MGKFHSRTYSDGNVRGAQTEVELSGQNLLGFTNSSRQGEHQGRMVHQLILIHVVRKCPLQRLDYRRINGKTFNIEAVGFDVYKGNLWDCFTELVYTPRLKLI